MVTIQKLHLINVLHRREKHAASAALNVEYDCWVQYEMKVDGIRAKDGQRDEYETLTRFYEGLDELVL